MNHAVNRAIAPPRLLWPALGGTLLIAMLIAISIGRYAVPFDRVVGILLANLIPFDGAWTTLEATVVENIRAPRVLMAVLVGAGLAVAGAALQGTFRNPLVGPQIIGVSSGASFGGALAIVFTDSNLALVALAFLFGLGAMVIVYAMSRVAGRSPVMMLVLAGVITSAFFTALVSLLKYVADPEDKLPAIVFWLMGSFAAASYEKLAWLAVPLVGSILILYLMRWHINVLSLGDEEASAMGLKVGRTRWIVILCVAAISAAVVAAAGVVGWVGLVVPHLARMVVGPDHKTLLPAAALMGGIYLLAMDVGARTLTPAEIPLGILTAIIGAPVFAWLLRRTQAAGWGRD